MKRPAFTLIEVLMASCILTMIPIGALLLTHTLCGMAKKEVEKVVAASYCTDVYYRLDKLDNENRKNLRDKFNLTPSLEYPIPDEGLATVTFNGTTQKILKRSDNWDNPKLIITRVKEYVSSGNDYWELSIGVEWGATDDTGKRPSFAITNSGFCVSREN